MSGHSKWSTIKRKKGALDAKRGKIFTKLIKEVTVAARLGGGDPSMNPRLRRAVDACRAANMPNDNITRGIKKGTGELEGVNYEELLYECVGPEGTLFVCEIMTDNRNRTAAEVRKILDKHSGQLGASGSATWAFDQMGVVRIPKDAAEEEQLFEIAVGAGAEDLRAEDEQWLVLTPREELDTVSNAIEGEGLKVEEAKLEYLPKTPKEITGDIATKLFSLVETLDDHDDVQNVFTDFDFSEEALAALDA